MRSLIKRVRWVRMLPLLWMISACSRGPSWEELNRQAGAFYAQGRYTEAVRVAEQALRVAEDAFGPGHSEVATSLHNLGEYYKAQSKYDEAETFFYRSLEALENTLGPDHLQVAHALDNLAGLHHLQEMYAEAEPLHRRALIIVEKALGVDHPDRAISLNNLAECYRNQGRFAEAEPLFLQALEIQEKVLGVDHPDRAISLNNLATMYFFQEKFAEAEPLFLQVLEIQGKELRPDHPQLATILSNLAVIYAVGRKFDEAESLFMRALEIQERALEAGHPDVVGMRDNIAVLNQLKMEGGEKRDDEATGFLTIRENTTWAILEDRQENLWFGTSAGVTRYNGVEFTTYTTQDGLAHDVVFCLLEDREGKMWFGTNSGVTRYDPQALPERLAQFGIVEDPQGLLQFDPGGKVRRDDIAAFVTFTTEDGLAGNTVWSILEDQQGRLWFGTSEGVSRYDSTGFVTFTVGDSLAHKDGPEAAVFSVWSILEDQQGRLWFGTSVGVSRYDSTGFVTFTTEDGLAHNTVWSILEDQQGRLWFGTSEGVSRYDGAKFTTFTAQNGLAHDAVRCMMEDRQGHLWFGTLGGGISRYDGQIFQNLLKQDGLADNRVFHMLQDHKGTTWIATAGGLSLYRPGGPLPSVRIRAVLADKNYRPDEQIRIPTSQDYLAVDFTGMSSDTRQIVYLYRLQGYDEEWQQTQDPRVVYTDLPRGDYTFQVKAIDRDLRPSVEPASVTITVHLPYVQIMLAVALGIAAVGLVAVSSYGVRKRRELRRTERALMQEMEEELQTAHDMQMGLMPTESPQIEDFDITGRCIPANHVGGDLFQYFQQDGKLAICLADVTGHAMEAAVPVMMFSGILYSQMEEGHPLEMLFTRLNGTLYATLKRRTFVCFAMSEVVLATRTLRLVNVGCPPVYHFRSVSGEVVELEGGGYPLGVRADADYETVEVQLELGDWIVFVSDGIIEAANIQEEIFSFERTAEVIRQSCQEELSAEELIDRLIEKVQAFAGDTPQGDDMTVVVLKVV